MGQIIVLMIFSLINYGNSSQIVTINPKNEGGSRRGEHFEHKKRNLLKFSRFLKCLAEREGDSE